MKRVMGMKMLAQVYRPLNMDQALFLALGVIYLILVMTLLQVQ